MNELIIIILSIDDYPLLKQRITECYSVYCTFIITYA